MGRGAAPAAAPGQQDGDLYWTVRAAFGWLAVVAVQVLWLLLWTAAGPAGTAPGWP
jgi:hypothetical protein